MYITLYKLKKKKKKGQTYDHKMSNFILFWPQKVVKVFVPIKSAQIG